MNQQAVQPAPAPAQSSPSVAGTSKFKLLAELGRGGMATVYLAVVSGPAGFNKLTVVKCLRPSLAAEAEFLEMFLAEARLAARINHPNVVQTNDVGFDEGGGYYYITMEYVDGPSLDTMVKKAGASFPLNLQLFIVIQMLHGLHHAHELQDFEGKPLNVVHRDVSPHNVMVSYDGHVKLLDFGIAKAADSSGNTRTGILKGKCAYMSAEQFGGQGVDRRADVFAAGVILWQAITGKKLWQGLSDAEIFARLSRGEIPSPDTVKHDLPPELVAITMRALQLKPEDRYATAADFAAALEDFVAKDRTYHATGRDLAVFVAQLFAKERAKMKEKIDEQLRQVAKVGTDLVTFAAEVRPTMGGGPTIVAAPPPRRGRMFALALLTLAALGTIGYVGTRKRAQGAIQDTASFGAAQAKVTIRAVPAAAKIFFDDAPLTGNPASATFQKDGLAHRVRAEAPGHARKTELVVLDSASVAVEIQLDPENKDDEVDPFGNKLTALTFKAVPANARLFIDNVLLPTNPSVSKLPRDGHDHMLRADAPGYVAKTSTVKFDKSRDAVTMTLDRDTTPATAAAPAKPGAGGAGKGAARDPVAPAAAPVAPPVAAAAAATPSPAPAASKKTLDRGDPWAN